MFQTSSQYILTMVGLFLKEGKDYSLAWGGMRLSSDHQFAEKKKSYRDEGHGIGDKKTLFLSARSLIYGLAANPLYASHS